MNKNKEEPLVTAVITTYKRSADILERALKSIVNQTYKNIEIIIVNDCPDNNKNNDDIKGMLRKYDNENIKYIVVEKNGGACKARNIALNASKGKYIAFLDDDDEWLPKKIELQVLKMETDSSCSIVYCNSISKIVEDNKEKIHFKEYQPEGIIYNILLKKNIIGSCSFPLIRTKDLLEVKGFREDMPALQDWELYIRILKNNSALYVDEPCVRYYFYKGDRLSRNHNNRIIAYEKILNEINDDLILDNDSSYEFYMMGVYFYSLAKDIRNAFRYYFKAIRLKKLNILKNTIQLVKMFARFFKESKRI